MSVYVVSHKEYDFPNERIYRPIQVGDGQDITELHDRDNNGDNIAHLNPYYCELTALYWIWKNTTDDIVGLVHYRRYFKSCSEGLKFKNKNIFSEIETTNLLNEYDLIVASPRLYFPFTVKSHYTHAHQEDDISALREVIETLYPEYTNSFDFIMNGYKLSLYNMFIGKKHVLDAYCEWLFNILFQLESKIDYSLYGNYQKRVFGFIAERLFNVWLHYNKGMLKIKRQPVVNIEGENYLFKAVGLLKRQFNISSGPK